MDIVGNVKNELSKWKNDVVGLDIETHNVKIDMGSWQIEIFEIGIYNKSKDKILRLVINPFYYNHLSSENDCNIMKFYKASKYKNVSGVMLTLDEVRSVFDGTVKFKTVFGHNIIAFDLKHLKAYGLQVVANRFFDTYLWSGAYLPLNYYLTLKEWESLPDIKPFKFFTEKGNLRMTAEAIYCFISGNPYFEEAHTATEDCIIEAEIYDYAQKRLKIKQCANSWKDNLQIYFSRFKFFNK